MTESIPNGFHVRTPTLADAGGVAALVNACSRADVGHDEVSPDTVLGWWQEPDRVLADACWLVIAPDGAIAAYLELLEGPPEARFDGYVHPTYHGHGIGAFLLTTIEERVQHDVPPAQFEHPITIQASLLDTNLAAQRLFAAHGFVPVREGLRMEIVLGDALPAPDWPTGIRMRCFERGRDERAVHETIETAFAGEWNHTPVTLADFVYQRITSRSDFDPSLWLMALEGEHIVGGVLCLPQQPGQPDVGWIDLLGVAPPWRGRGIGMALLRAAFAAFQRRGTTRVGLAVWAASGTRADRLYRRAGMRVIERGLAYEKVLSSEGCTSNSRLNERRSTSS